MALLLGVWFVGRPVRLLAARARRIAAGDFEGRLELRQADELADLAGEINSMSDRLAEAQRRVASETAARIDAIEQLRHADRLRTVGQLTSGIAHELGTPLNVVWERAKMIAGDPAASGPCADNARVIAEQSARMTKIIRQLLDFSRPARPKKVRIDLRLVIRQTISLLQPALQRRRVEATLEGADEPVCAAVDVDQMQQVASNLVLNAVHAMPDGGPLTVTTGFRRCRPPAADVGSDTGFAYIAVRDRGRGIDVENRARVFDPFFTTKDIGEGTGLGLSVALGIVKEHGGWIEVESTPGQGACFTVYVPEESAACAAKS
jgi:signal transduction histidine kinase